MLACVPAPQQDRRCTARRGGDQAAGRRLRQAWPDTQFIVPWRLGLLPPACAATGASARTWATSSAWRATRGCTRRWPSRSWHWPTTTSQRRQAAAHRRVRLRGQELAARAARDHAAGVRGAGHQPALHRHQPRGRPVHAVRRLYCQRGEAENRIKEAQLDLFGTRASCPRFVANQLRLLLAALAYTLMVRLRAAGAASQRAGARHGRQHPLSAAQDRRGDPAQHAPRARVAGQPSSAARAVRQRRCTAGCAGSLKPIQCCPRHVDKQRGQGGSAPEKQPQPFQWSLHAAITATEAFNLPPEPDCQPLMKHPG
jgi:hypothetical protein